MSPHVFMQTANQLEYLITLFQKNYLKNFTYKACKLNNLVHNPAFSKKE